MMLLPLWNGSLKIAGGQQDDTCPRDKGRSMFASKTNKQKNASKAWHDMILTTG
jgi:hypothetical protein